MKSVVSVSTKGHVSIMDILCECYTLLSKAMLPTSSSCSDACSASSQQSTFVCECHK